MLLDVFDNDNSISVNYRTIQIFGLPTAVYLTELINIYKKATRKNKLIDDNYFKVDRKYISNILCLTPEEQIVCDLNLVKTSVLKKSNDNPDILKLDIKLYLSLLTSEDFKLYDDVKKQMKIQKPKGTKESQRQQYINVLKSSIDCSNYELLTALRDWVDGVYARPNGFLSKSAVKIFQDTLNNYTKGNLDIALRIVQIATVQGYRDCTWAINMFEDSEKRRLKQLNNSVRVTEQKVSDKKELSDVVF
jgi:hypothetical protein